MSTDKYEYHRRVVCAANLAENGAMVIGPRHYDMTMHAMIKIIHDAETAQGVTDLSAFHEQGFIDQHGVFMTRQEAWKVAVTAGQIIRRCGGDDANGGTLYSENLY